MGDSEVFCFYCKEYVVLWIFCRYKVFYCKGECIWDLDVFLIFLFDEELLILVNYEDDCEEILYDEVFKFMDFEIEGEGDEEYMEVDFEWVKEMIEFWEDVIEDIIVDFEEDVELVVFFLIDVEDMDRIYLN